MIEPQESTPTPHPVLGRVVGAVDRYCPYGWLAFYALLPVSGWGYEMFGSWHDQSKFLRALREVVSSGESPLVTDNIIGPAYVALARGLHEALGLTLEESLVVLNRIAYALSVAAALVLVRVVVTRLAHVPPMVSLTSQVTLLAVLFASGTWWWSDVPWTHFVATALAVGVFAVRFAPVGAPAACAALAGCLLALLAATRTFEFLALVLAWGIALLVLGVLRMAPRIEWTVSRIASGGLAFFVTTLIVYAATGKRSPFFLYAGNLDSQSADVLAAEIAETPRLILGLVPTKLVQLFVDPCYLALCPVSDYETGGGRGSNLDLWSLPLAVQLPALTLLPLCGIAVGVLLFVVRRNERSDRATLRVVQLELELAIAASGIALGYVAATIAGSPHLRFGFAREFMLPALLAAIVAVSLGSVALWRCLALRARRVPSSELAFLVLMALASVTVVVLMVHVRSTGLPRIEARHIVELQYVARCEPTGCRVGISATNRAGDPVALPHASVLTFGCGSARPRYSVYAQELGREVAVDPGCREPRLVAAWPLVMGLPPGRPELAAVKVRNA